MYYMDGAVEGMQQPFTASATIVKEGFLRKRGEFIRNWRRRYFYLLSDGRFLGYRQQRPENILQPPSNNFTVKDCHLMIADRPKPNCFIIRGLQWSNVVERILAASTPGERKDWVDAIRQVAAALKTDVQIVDAKKSVLLQLEQNRPRKTLSDFDFIKTLGKGTFGKVVLCQDKITKHLHAIKVLKKAVIIEKEEVIHTITESKVLQRTKHPFLIELKYSFQNSEHLCFVMEYVNGGELYFHLEKEKIFTVERTRFYGAEIILAIGYLHSHKIVYRDLKLENLLLDKEGHIKIADFGLCKEDMSFDKTTQTFCGTPEYLAPEVLKDMDYGLSVDWWGVGVVMFEMMCGRLPFYSRNHEELFGMIIRNPVRFPSNIPMEGCLLLAGLLEKCPKKRLGGGLKDVEEIKAQAFFFGVDWNALLEKRIQAPYLPPVSDEFDTSLIAIEFTKEPPFIEPANFEEKVLTSQFPNAFLDFDEFDSSLDRLGCDSEGEEEVVTDMRGVTLEEFRPAVRTAASAPRPGVPFVPSFAPVPEDGLNDQALNLSQQQQLHFQQQLQFLQEQQNLKQFQQQRQENGEGTEQMEC